MSLECVGNLVAEDPRSSLPPTQGDLRGEVRTLHETSDTLRSTPPPSEAQAPLSPKAAAALRLARREKAGIKVELTQMRQEQARSVHACRDGI